MADHPTEQVDRRPISVLIHDPEPDPFDPITADEIREVLQDVGYPVQSVILQQGFPAPSGLDIPRPSTEQVDRTLQELLERHRAEAWPDGTGSNCTECNGRRFPCPTRQGLDRLRAALDAATPELDRLHTLIQRGLAYGDAFRTPYAAGARAELRRIAGMTPPSRAGSVGERDQPPPDDYCEMHGPGLFQICSTCQYPPCQRVGERDQP